MTLVNFTPLKGGREYRWIVQLCACEACKKDNIMKSFNLVKEKVDKGVKSELYTGTTEYVFVLSELDTKTVLMLLTQSPVQFSQN